MITYKWKITGLLTEGLILPDDKWEKNNIVLHKVIIGEDPKRKERIKVVTYVETNDKSRESALSKGVQDFKRFVLPIWSILSSQYINLDGVKIVLLNEEELKKANQRIERVAPIAVGAYIVKKTKKNELDQSFDLKNKVEENPNRNTLLRSINWFHSSLKQSDSFDKYIYSWIAFNILHNLHSPVERSEFKRVRCMKNLIQYPKMFIKGIEKEHKFTENFSDYTLRNSKDEDIKQKLFDNYKNCHYLKATEDLLECLYIIRCSLFHGEKDIEQRQKSLVELSFGILSGIYKKCLVNFLNKM